MMTGQEIIDRLEIWRRDGIAEDDLIPPTEAAIYRTIGIVKGMVRRGRISFERLVPDDGGIHIQTWHNPRTIETFKVDGSGKAERVVLRDGKVVGRMKIYD